MDIPDSFFLLLQPSVVGGVGVFTTRLILEGSPIYFGKGTQSTRRFIKDVPPEFLKYCIYVNEEECIGPERFERMEIGWYLNHSHMPNIKKHNGEMMALRPIQAGEELFMDYNQLNEPESMKEPYYRY